MCGIVGLSTNAKIIDRSRLRAATDAIAHRGPDDYGLYLSPDEKSGLGHTRLAILDTSSAGHQPMRFAEAGTVIVFNGEIYNFADLRSELIAEGIHFSSRSDTEVLLKGYTTWGDAILPRLNGMFAFAIFNERTNSLFIARDQLGVKPLYYAASHDSFAFSSEIKSLVHLAPDSIDLDALAIARYVKYLWCPGERTPLRGVRKLSPGSAMTIHAGRITRQWNWWKLPSYTPRQDWTRDQCATQVLETLDRSVARQLVSDVPIGAFLSGGIDSTAVVASARREVSNVDCFTINVKGDDEPGVGDDLPYARLAAKHLDVKLHEVQIDADQMWQHLDWMVRQLDEPLADPACLNVSYICQVAAANGIKVLLSGTGGDDIFTGYRRHKIIEIADHLRWCPRSVFDGLGYALTFFDRGMPTIRRASRALSLLSVDSDSRLLKSFEWTDDSLLFSLLSEEMRAEIAGATLSEPLVKAAHASQGIPELEKCLMLEKRFFLSDHNLLYTDKMSMASGVEVRVPLLDMELIDLAAHIPVGWKQKGSSSKGLFKESQKQRLPESILIPTAGRADS